MKLRLSFILLFMVAGSYVYSQCFTYTVDACIDYDDYLYISGDSLWWVNFGGSDPNTHSGCSPAVTVNGVDWTPWNSIYILPNSTRNCTMVATVLQCSNICNVIQEPTAANGWEGIYDFNDEGPSGAHPYSIEFAFFCPVVTICADTIICAGSTANLYATGGTTYSWSPTASLSCPTCANPQATPTTTTTYTVTATDAYNCTGTASVTVTVNPIVITPASTPVSCFGGSNGFASIVVSGGNPALTYAWSNGPTTTNNPNLIAGPYTVTVTDARNCSNTASVSVSQPVLLTATATTTNVTCNGLSNGAITVSPNGGTSPYTYTWNDGATTIAISNVAAGIYSVTIIDNNSCNTALTDTVTQPPLLVVSATGANVLCNGGSDGAVTLSVSGGTPAIAYNWSNGSTSQNLTGVPANAYSVTATDAQSCTASSSATISQPTLLYAGETQVVDVSCNGGNNGSIAITDTGGTAPYSWLWSNGNTSQNTGNLAAGNYSVTATDSHACTASASVAITQPGAIVITTTHVNDSCFGAADGSINLALSGGVVPFTFAWNDGNADQDRTNLAYGNYTVTATDSDNCSASVSVSISQPTLLTVGAAITPVTCYGGDDGAIAVTDGGGTTPYTYSWNDGVTTQNRTQMDAGTFTITVTDALLCTATASAVVTQPGPLAFAPVVVNPLCPSVDHNGSIILNVTGGTSPYTYFWSDSSTLGSRLQLTAASFAVTVTDANGCTADDNFTLEYLFDYTVIANPAATLMLGQSEPLTYNLSGNAGAYTSVWTPPSGLSCNTCASPIASPVRTTLYNITVQNDSGCSVSDTVTVYVIPQYNIFIPNAFAPGGNGSNNFFSIYGNIQQLEFIQVEIFDRLGEKVFESSDINFAWDGTYKGYVMPPGVYVYTMKLVFIDGHTEKLRTGSLTLLR